MIELWNAAFFQPILNGLIYIYGFLFSNFGLAIIAFTILIRLATYPLTRRQIESTKKMSALQPKLQELQKKYSRDKETLAREQMKLYREMGINPMGCLWPMLIQFPIWIAVYQAVRHAVVSTPQGLLNLSQYLYSWSVIDSLVPVKERFLWLNLAVPDSLLIFPILVGGSLWLQQKMSMLPSADPRQQSMNRMMLWMMPLMFAFFTLQFPSGLALYWAVFNIIGIIMQYRISGWGGLKPAPSIPPPVPKTEPVSEKPKARQVRKRSQPSRHKETGVEKKSGGQHQSHP